MTPCRHTHLDLVISRYHGGHGPVRSLRPQTGVMVVVGLVAIRVTGWETGPIYILRRCQTSMRSLETNMTEDEQGRRDRGCGSASRVYGSGSCGGSVRRTCRSDKRKWVDPYQVS